MTLSQRLSEYIRACFAGLWIESHEHADALVEIARLCRDEQWQLATWDIDSGLSIPGQPETDTNGSDPLAAIRSVNALATPSGTPILVLQNFHRFMQSAEIVQVLALWIIDAMAPCVAMIDEIEKAFAGMNGQGDSGVASRMFGQFLSWLNDHESDVFVVCTANDVSKLPPEFGRSERFDGTFFLDLPGRDEKDAIWDIYLGLYEINRDQRMPDDAEWTGAEIKACCRLSALLDVPLKQAAQNVVPVAVTAAESVERLRSWASGRCLSANESGIYRHTSGPSKSRRRVSRDPSNN